MKRLLLALFVVAGALCLAPATAIQVPHALSIGNQPLLAASCASRETLWIHHYVAALYVPQRETPVTALQDPKKPKALLVQVLSRSFLPREMPKKWVVALERELDPDQMQRVHDAWQRLAVGDRVMVAYAPGRGVTLDLNERTVARAREHRLVQALLETWADGQPVPAKVNAVVEKHPCQ